MGALIIQPELARSLEDIAAGGAEVFYRGRLAQQLAKALKECGALITEADLAEFEAEAQEPLAIDYHGLQILEAPPNSTGFVLLEELKILENFDIAADGVWFRRSRACNGRSQKASLCRSRALGQRPAHVGRSFVGAALSRVRGQAGGADRHEARRSDQAAGTTETVSGAGGETTYFCTADERGNAVSGIQSINSLWGSGVTAGETGILLNNRMAYWHLEPGHPNYLRPGRRVRHTMNPPLVLKDGQLWGVFGTPGADNQVQVNFQIATAMVDFGLDPQQAAEMPRWSSMVPGQYADYPHDGPDVLTMERRFPEEVWRELARRGHPVDIVGDLEGPCSVEIIRREDDMLLAGSDPRRDGWALAW